MERENAMNTNSHNKPTNRAAAALNSLLAQVSAVTLKGMDVAFPLAACDAPGAVIDIVAHVEVLGRVHSLACQICSAGESQDARAILDELRGRILSLPGKVTPILILPVLSPEVQALCSENDAGCLDLRGNGRIALDEVFISMRSLPRRVLHKPETAASPLRSSVPGGDEAVLRGFPPAHVNSPRRAPVPAGRAAAH